MVLVQKMIAFINRFHFSPKWILHDIHRSGTLSKPSDDGIRRFHGSRALLFLAGELRLNSAGLIVSTSIPGSVHA